MNLSPGGLEDGPPGFPYFATADGKFEFGYGGPPFHPHDSPFFPGPHPGGPGGGQGMPFSQPGKFSHYSPFGVVQPPFLLLTTLVCMKSALTPFLRKIIS